MTGTDVHGQKMLADRARRGHPDRRAGPAQFRCVPGAAARSSTSPSTASSAPPTPTTIEASQGHLATDETPRRHLPRHLRGLVLGARRARSSPRPRPTLRDDGMRVATETGTPVTWTEEQTYFFRLSAYADRLLAHYEAHPEFIGPDARRNEIVSFVSGGLHDLSISRTTFDWGVPVPGHPEHVMYVWVDALTNYLTGVGLPGHRFRAVPAVLARRSAHDRQGHHPLPRRVLAGVPDVGRNRACRKRVFAHGFVNNKGEKMSKSVGNVVDPVDLVETFGAGPGALLPAARDLRSARTAATATRPSSAGSTPTWPTSSATWPSARCRWWPRTSTAVVPDARRVHRRRPRCSTGRRPAGAGAGTNSTSQAMHLALEAIWLMLGAANRYFSAQEPWVLRKSERRADQQRFAHRALHDPGGGAHRRAAGAAGDAGFRGQAARPARPAGRPAAASPAIGARLVPGTALPAPTGVFPRYQAD